MTDNYVNTQVNIMNAIGIEYDFRMDKHNYQGARIEIKHFIYNGGELVEKDKLDLFKDYCRQVFEKYLPKEV